MNPQPQKRVQTAQMNDYLLKFLWLFKVHKAATTNNASFDASWKAFSSNNIIAMQTNLCKVKFTATQRFTQTSY